MCDKKVEQKQKQHEWYLKNRDRIIEHQKEYIKHKISTDYNFRMKVINYQSKYYQKNKDKRKQDMINNYYINKQKEKDNLLKLEPYIKKNVNISNEDLTVIF